MIPAHFKQRILPFMSAEELIEIDSLYPEEKSGLPSQNVSRLMGDYFFNCPARRLAKTYTSVGLPVFRSRFDHQLFNVSIPILKDVGVLHGSDMPYWWKLNPILDETGKQLARALVKGVVDFSRCTKNNNCQIGAFNNSIQWPRYTESQGVKVLLDSPISTISTDRDDQIDAKCNAIYKAIEMRGSYIVGQSPPIQPTKPTWNPVVDALLNFFKGMFQKLVYNKVWV
jgi:carboxylesterase type B